MAGNSGGAVLRSLIAAGSRHRGEPAAGKTPPPRAEPVTPERAASTALARAAERTHRLPVFVDKVSFSPVSLSELPEILPERALLAVVEGPRERLGVVAICSNLLASLIEMQALGRVTTRPATPRRATRTDAAISEDFVNILLAEMHQALRDHPDLPAFASFRYVTYLDDPRPLGLMLEDGNMSRIALEFRIGPSGQRRGSLLIAMPVGSPAIAATPAHGAALLKPPEGDGTVRTAPPEHGPTLAGVMQDVPLFLSGVLCRRTLTLRALRNLAPGALIPLPQNALDDARIESGTGQLLARGRLGEADGFHAIRVSAGRTMPADMAADPAEPDPFRVSPLAEQSVARAAG